MHGRRFSRLGRSRLVKTPLAFIGAVALPLYALDQWTKGWVIHTIPPDSSPRPVIEGFFYLCHWQNTGAAFSMGTGNNGFFVVLSIITLAGLLFFAARGAFRDVLSRMGVALLVGGILGNLTDRLRFAHVVDFLLFYLKVPFTNIPIPHADPWPAFNVADSCICTATALFLIAAILDKRKPAETPAGPEKVQH
jgi:signal peptidase II